jgi:hypothetical protein
MDTKTAKAELLTALDQVIQDEHEGFVWPKR